MISNVICPNCYSDLVCTAFKSFCVNLLAQEFACCHIVLLLVLFNIKNFYSICMLGVLQLIVCGSDNFILLVNDRIILRFNKYIFLICYSSCLICFVQCIH